MHTPCTGDGQWGNSVGQSQCNPKCLWDIGGPCAWVWSSSQLYSGLGIWGGGRQGQLLWSVLDTVWTNWVAVSGIHHHLYVQGSWSEGQMWRSQSKVLCEASIGVRSVCPWGELDFLLCGPTGHWAVDGIQNGGEASTAGILMMSFNLRFISFVDFCWQSSSYNMAFWCLFFLPLVCPSGKSGTYWDHRARSIYQTCLHLGWILQDIPKLGHCDLISEFHQSSISPL